MLLGKRIKELRKEHGYTQSQLGSLINVTKVSVCCYESGTRTPTLDTLVDLANIFQVSVNELIGYDKYVVSDNDVLYGIHMATEEIEFIKELRKYNELYDKLMKDPKRMIEFMNKKIR